MRVALVLTAGMGILAGQTLSNASITGSYHFAQLVVAAPGGNINTVRTGGGRLTFNGAGAFTFSARSGENAVASAAVNGSGTYAVQPNGFVTLSNPLASGLTVNARLGTGGEAVIGSSTESGGAYDFFVAVRAPETGSGNTAFSGTYSGSTLTFPSGQSSAARSAFFTLTANGQGAISQLTLTGHEAQRGNINREESVVNASYTLSANGSGTANLGFTSGLLTGSQDLFVSAGGDYVLGYSNEPGDRGILVGVRRPAAQASNSSFQGNYWTAGFAADPPLGAFSAYSGSIRSTGGGKASTSLRTRDSGRLIDFSGFQQYTLHADQTGFLGPALEPQGKNFANGASVFALAQSGTVGQVTPFHGIAVGIRVPDIQASGVAIAPYGVLNGASFSPPTYPISGGTLLSIFGANLAAGTVSANSAPLPKSLNGVSVSVNGVAAPLFFVSPGQINIQVPFATSGSNATISVTNNGTKSNEIFVPVAASSPGIFSVSQDGTGPGIVTHADYRLLTPQSPARPGETVIIFLTGLGAVNPTFPDGAAGPLAPLARTTDTNLQVLFGGIAGKIEFSGAAPGFVGLYQLNVTLPDAVLGGDRVPVTIVTSNAVSDMTEIAIRR